MSIMRTKGQGYVTISSMPKISMSSWFTNYYQQNQNQKNLNIDSNRKLVIQNYAKDLGSGVFWGWDIISADETDEYYLFQLKHRQDSKLRVYITLGRELQVSNLENNLYQMYQCYMHDDLGEWNETIWFDSTNLNHPLFWGKVETIVDKHHPLLPF